jgi:outer membrane protease
MKIRRFYLLTLTILSAPMLLAEGSFSGSLSIFSGFFFGEMYEELYEEDTLVSRLEWDEHIVPMLGYEGELFFHNFFIGAELLTAIPVESGLMRDTDWMNSGHTAKTHYSEHTAAFLKHYEFCGRIGYRLSRNTVLGSLEIAPSVGMGYRAREWAAQDGFLQYSSFGDPWTDDIPKQQVKGNIITYESSTWWPLIGLNFGLTIKDRWSVGLEGNWYPWLQTDSIDSHYLKLERYIDTMRGGMGALVHAQVSYHPASLRGMEFTLGIGWEGVFPDKGKTSTGDIGQSDALILEKGYYSKTESKLWWIDCGITLYPDELVTRK